MMDEKLLDALEKQSEIMGVRVVLIAAFQAGQLIAYGECLKDISKPEGSVAKFLEDAPGIAERARMGECDA